MALDVETAGDRPATRKPEEIKITPEMIEAGVNCLWVHPIEMYPSGDEMKKVVFDLFKAMAEAHPRYSIAG